MEAENYAEFLPNKDQEMEGTTSNISIKTNNRVTEITIKNQDIPRNK